MNTLEIRGQSEVVGGLAKVIARSDTLMVSDVSSIQGSLEVRMFAMFRSSRKMKEVSVAILLAMALSSCGGGGGGDGGVRPTEPTPVNPTRGLSLPPGHGLSAGEITVPAGASEEHGNVVVTCPAGGDACVVTVAPDGTAEYTRTGGVPSVMAAYDSWGLPSGHRVNVGVVTVAAGVSEEHGNVVVTCPPGGSACIVRVAPDGTAEYARTGGVPTFMYVNRSFQRDNPTAEDLLDHWNEPEQLRRALGLSMVSFAELADRRQAIANLVNMAEGGPAKTGTKLRNVRPEDIEIIGERRGITYGRWTGGPAGTLNIEFDWRFAADVTPAERAMAERAGKSWSHRLRDEFGAHVVERGTTIRSQGVHASAVAREVTFEESVETDGILVVMTHSRSDPLSSAGPWQADITANDYEPWLGVLNLSQGNLDERTMIGNYWLSHVFAHELGHIIGITSHEGGWHVPSHERHLNRQDHTFEGPRARSANGGNPVPFQWLDQDRRVVPPHTPGADVDYYHLGVCVSIMAYCTDPRETYQPSEIDFAFLSDIGYELLDAETANEPELYGYGAWGRYSGWGAGVERVLRYVDDGSDVVAHDSLQASADAFGTAPRRDLAVTHASLQGGITWSGAVIGVDLGRPMLPPVFGDAELRVELSTLRGTASFDDLTVHVEGVSSAFRTPQLEYDVNVAGNAFSDQNGRVRGGFYGPAHEEMAGVLDDRRTTVNLLAGFGGAR